MTSQPSDRRGTSADNSDLDPQLREIVDGIRGEAPSDELLQRSMDRLRAVDPSVVRRRSPSASRRITGFLVFAAALCLISVVVVWQVLQSGTENELVNQSPPPTPEITPPAHYASNTASERSLWSYHSAAVQSPEDFLSLLEEHSDQSAFSGPESLQMGIPLVTQEITL